MEASFPLSCALKKLLGPVRYGDDWKKYSALSRSLFLMVYAEFTAGVVAVVKELVSTSRILKTQKKREFRTMAFLCSKDATSLPRDKVDEIDCFSDIIFYALQTPYTDNIIKLIVGIQRALSGESLQSLPTWQAAHKDTVKELVAMRNAIAHGHKNGKIKTSARNSVRSMYNALEALRCAVIPAEAGDVDNGGNGPDGEGAVEDEQVADADEIDDIDDDEDEEGEDVKQDLYQLFDDDEDGNAPVPTFVVGDFDVQVSEGVQPAA